jgi:hypothetical protein
LDAILRDNLTGEEEHPSTEPVSFRQFMLASPLADVELSVPGRPVDWRKSEL